MCDSGQAGISSHQRPEEHPTGAEGQHRLGRHPEGTGSGRGLGRPKTGLSAQGEHLPALQPDVVAHSFPNALSSLCCHPLSHCDGRQASGLSAENPAGFLVLLALVQQELRDLNHGDTPLTLTDAANLRGGTPPRSHPSATWVVFPEPVAPTTSTTRLSLMSCRISCLCSCTGRQLRKASCSEGFLCGGTTGMPLFKRPLALFLSRLLSERRNLPDKRLWKT